MISEVWKEINEKEKELDELYKKLGWKRISFTLTQYDDESLSVDMRRDGNTKRLVETDGPTEDYGVDEINAAEMLIAQFLLGVARQMFGQRWVSDECRI